MKLTKKHLKKIIQGTIAAGAIVTACTGCVNHQTDTKVISSKISQKDVPQDTQQAGIEQVSEVKMALNDKQSRQVKEEDLKKVAPKQLYVTFKETIEKVANDTLGKKQIPSAVARDLDGDGLEELLIITGESEGSGLLIQIYEYELETNTCYLSDEMKRGMGSSADGAAFYSLYADDQGNYLINIFSGRDFGESETTIKYEQGKLQIYSYKDHTVARGWMEKEKEEVYRHIYTYKLGEKEVSEGECEKALQNYKKVIEIATTPYARDTISDKTNGAEEVMKRYRELTNDDQATLVIKGSNFIEDGKLSINSHTVNEFMSMNLDELSELFGSYTKSEYEENVYFFKDYNFFVYSEVNKEVMAATFYGSTKVMGISFGEYAKDIAEQLGRPEQDYYNEHDDQQNWIYTIGSCTYTLAFNAENGSLESIMVQTKN